MPDDETLLEAEFDPRVRTYWLLNGTIVFVASIVGIVLLPLWYWLGWYFSSRYLRRLKCTLTERTLQVSKGVLNRVEKTIPLDKITDLGYFQGPVMRYLGIDGLTVETAGQSSSEGALVKLHGVARRARLSRCGSAPTGRDGQALQAGQGGLPDCGRSSRARAAAGHDGCSAPG